MAKGHFTINSDLVSANSGRRHYRLHSNGYSRELRITHNRKGWWYRFEDGEERGPCPSVEAARRIALDVFMMWVGNQQQEQQRGIRPGAPVVPGQRGKFHGVEVQWTNTGLVEDEDELTPRHYSLLFRECCGEVMLHPSERGRWSYRLSHPGGKRQGPATYRTADEALDTAVRVFFAAAKQFMKRHASDTSG